jgi:hypothetical protein
MNLDRFRDFRDECAATEELTSDLLSNQLEANRSMIHQLFGESPDLIIRQFSIQAE